MKVFFLKKRQLKTLSFEIQNIAWNRWWVSLRLPSMHGGSLEIMLKIPSKGAALQ